MKRRISGWIISHNAISQAVVFFIAVAVGALRGGGALNDAVEALLALIVLEFVLFLGIHSENIREKIHAIHDCVSRFPNRNLEIIEGASFDWKGEVEKAQSDVFISGSTLSRFYLGEPFRTWPEGISLRIMSLDFEDEEQIRNFCKMRWPDYSEADLSLEYQTSMRRLDSSMKKNPKAKIEYARSHCIMPAMFIAVDLDCGDSEKTFIKAQYYFYGKNADSPKSCFSILVRPGHELYDSLKQQINEMWRLSRKGSKYLT